LILQQAAPLSAQDLLAQLSRQMGLGQLPEQGGTREANGLTWALYAFSARGVRVDMAIAESDGVAMVVLMQSIAAERKPVREVFLRRSTRSSHCTLQPPTGLNLREGHTKARAID
jgi:hypothetical protein